MLQQLRTQKLNATFWLVLVTLLAFVVPIIQLVVNVSFTSFSIQHPLVKLIVTMLGSVGAGLLVNNICNRNRFLSSASNLPMAFTILFGSGLLYFSWLELISFILMILMVNKLAKSYFHSSSIVNYFDVAMLIGILSVFSLPNAILLIALWLSIPVLSTVKFTKYLLTILGFILVWFFVGVYVYVFVPQVDLASLLIKLEPHISFDLVGLNYLHYFSGIFVFLSVALALSKKRFLRGVQSPFLFFSSVFIVLLVLISLFFKTAQYNAIAMVVAPLAIVTSYYFYGINKKLANLLFYMVIGTVIVLQVLIPIV